MFREISQMSTAVARTVALGGHKSGPRENLLVQATDRRLATILVPIDLSYPEQAGKTLGLARHIGTESRVVALYVSPDIPSFVSGELPEELVERNLSNARKEIAFHASQAGAETEVRWGHPPMVILEYAKEICADLIVVASHRPGPEDYFLGATAARVVRHALCPVLVDRDVNHSRDCIARKPRRLPPAQTALGGSTHAAA